MRQIKALSLAFASSLLIFACDNTSNPDPVTPPAEEPEEPNPTPEPEPTPEEPADDFLTDSQGRTFSYVPVGDLLPQSGPGHTDGTIYRPDIQFPLEDAAFLNSQVYRHGGGQGSLNGMNGGQCDASNYSYPWQDTFCESRGRSQIMCPTGGHEGLDIRAASCIPQTDAEHWAVAVEDGQVVGLASSRYTVKLQTNDGTLYRYLHLKMSQLAVSDGEMVVKGQRIGKVSNDFFNSAGEPVPTTYHLHFEMYQNYAPDEETSPVFDQVNPYMTLVNAYERKLRAEE